MLVLAPAACIVGGIALSAAFETLTRSIKYAPTAPPALLLPAEKVRARLYKYFSPMQRSLGFETVVFAGLSSPVCGMQIRIRADPSFTRYVQYLYIG